MTRIRIPWIVLLLALLLYTAAVQADTAGYQKITVLTFGYDGGTYHETAGEVRYGTAPNLNISSGSLKGVILDSTGREIRTFYLQDPTATYSDPPLPAGTSVSAAGNGRAVTLTVTLPYLATSTTFRLYDRRNGMLLATADLSEPFAGFCTGYPSDPDCLSSATRAGSTAPAPAWMVAATLIVAAIVAACGMATGAILIYRKPRRLQRPVVLAADNSPENAGHMQAILAQKGFSVLTASGGKECLDLLKKQIPDVILLDVMMAPPDGWTVLERIRADPATKSVPVLIITAKPLAPEDVRQYHVCIDDYILKPFSNEELYSAVSHILERKRKIAEDLSRVQKAGVPKETFCELQKLAKRVEVDRRLLARLRRQYASAASGHEDGSEFWVTAQQLISSSLSCEIRLEELRRQITAVCRAKGCPAPEWDE